MLFIGRPSHSVSRLIALRWSRPLRHRWCTPTAASIVPALCSGDDRPDEPFPNIVSANYFMLYDPHSWLQPLNMFGMPLAGKLPMGIHLPPPLISANLPVP
jgi:hypothetical protein